MNKSFKSIVYLASLLLAIFTVVSCSKPTAKQNNPQQEFINEETLAISTIEGNHYIAIAAPLTGPYRELGKTIVEGANLAVEEFNNTTDYKHRIGTIIIDDGGIVSEGLGKATIVIEQNALGLIGHLNSAISIEASKRYAAAQIPEISPASTHPKYTERPDVKGYVFRTIGTDRQLGEAAADYVLSKPEFKRVAVLYNDRPYGVSVASEFVRLLAKDSQKDLVIYETIPVRTTDHKRTARRVAEKKADLVFFIGEYNDAGYLVKDLKKFSPDCQFLAAEGVHNQKFIDIAGKYAEDSLIIGAKQVNPEIEAIYNKRFGKASSGYVGTSYQATKILLAAIKANNFKAGKGIANNIAKDSIFDPNGDLIHPDFVLYQVVGAKFTVTN